MKIKVKKTKTYKITLSHKELDALALAGALMLQNEYTHPSWINKLEPVVMDMRHALNLDPDPYL